MKSLIFLLKLSEFWLMMLPYGTLVRVRYPTYAEGLMGVIEAHEKKAKRWIIKLQNPPFDYKNNSVILSLEFSEFEIIDFPSLVENYELIFAPEEHSDSSILIEL